MNKRVSQGHAAAQHAADAVYSTRHDPDAEGDVVDMAPGRAPSTVVSVRLSSADLAELEAAARRSGLAFSAFLRQSALAAARQPGWVSAQTVAGEIRRTETQVSELMAALRASVEAGRVSDSPQRVSGNKPHRA